MVIFETEKANYAVLICYESAFPGFVRDAILDGAELLVNITNDTWFGRSPGPYQHMRFAVFRAIENRVWLARCANSGISALIDPYGREIEKAGLYVQSVISGNIKPLSEKSTFTRIGKKSGGLIPIFRKIQTENKKRQNQTEVRNIKLISCNCPCPAVICNTI
ncbi:MAG: apolipoprotein N-acyltransferase [Deltaproteobacteria bacterium]|nr:apolipoprotein N-acyltransferase [Deltaproteobacteria bacterium]